MEVSNFNLNVKFVFIFLLVINLRVYPQINFESISAGVGVGSIGGNSPEEFALTFNPSIELQTHFWNNVFFHIGFIYAKDFNVILPEENFSKYYPYIYGGYLNASTFQLLNKNFFFEQELGAVFLKDKTYSDRNENGLGINISSSIGYLFNEFQTNRSGSSITIKMGYAKTFTNTLPYYFLVAVSYRYFVY